MNKKNMIFAASLMLSVATIALPFGEQERGALYDLHSAGHDLRTIGLNRQTVDMFIQLFGMNIEKIEKQLKAANEQMNSALINTGAITVGGNLLGVGLATLMNGSDKDSQAVVFGKEYGVSILMSLKGICVWFSALNVYDAYKVKKALTVALALDKEIMSQLLDLKDSLPAEEQSVEITEVQNAQ